MADFTENNLLSQIKRPAPKLSAEQRNEIASRLCGIAEAIGEKITPERIYLYMQSIQDLPFVMLKSALELMLLSSRWFPKIPDIRDAVLGKPEDRAQSDDAQAEAAWLRCLKYANRWHPDTDDPPIGLTGSEAQSLNMAGGIYQLWTLQDEGGKELAFMRRAFIESYKRRDRVHDALMAPRRNRELGSGGLTKIGDVFKERQ